MNLRLLKQHSALQRRIGWAVGALSLVLASPSSWADDHKTHDELLRQAERPTIEQVRHALGPSWNPTSLPDGSALPKDSNRPYVAWQNNFGMWVPSLIKNGPAMIAEFERSFPGATWVFIGRDMALFADLFESFYSRIGQTDRVIRLGMSSGTLVQTLPDGTTRKINEDEALKLLESHGIQTKKLEHPYIFIDAISRGGGRQGRVLMNFIFDSERKAGRDPSRLLFYFNLIGLVVRTTAIPEHPVRSALEFLRSESVRYEKNPALNFENEHRILTYNDGILDDGFHMFSEAGYTHWTGYWSDSYGPVVFDDSGKARAKVGSPASEEMRRAILDVQAYVFKAATAPEFLNSVQAEAYKLSYEFPTTYRPTYVRDPEARLRQHLANATNGAQLVEAVQAFTTSNYGRVSKASAAKTIEANFMNNHSLTGLPLAQAKAVVGMVGPSNFSAPFYLALLMRTEDQPIVRQTMHDWILGQISTCPQTLEAYSNQAVLFLVETTQAKDGQIKAIEAALNAATLTLETRMRLLQMLFLLTQDLDQQLAVVQKASQHLQRDATARLLDTHWYGTIIKTARTEGRTSEAVAALAGWFKSAALNNYATQVLAQLELVSTPEQFLALIGSDQLKDVRRNLSLIGETLFYSLFFKTGAKGTHVNSLAALLPEQKERVLIHSLPHIKTVAEFDELKLPSIFSQSRELKDEIAVWKSKHPETMGFQGLMRSCRRSLLKN